MRNKTEREQATKQFNTRLPRELYDEICAFLKENRIRFDATNAAEAVAGTKQILGSVFERTVKDKWQKGEGKDETSILSVSCIDEGAGGS